MKRLRCAIYTRKSSEEGLDQAFNSLHAQREACEAYVLSQAGEGWEAQSAHYDDGGFSGGSMQRPALARLLAEIDAGEVDVVVVYKVDRLTRSLGDFARIVERFDKVGVSFVSVTQAFNTTSSMGRLTLNVLLSFAQFEREVTGERIRDKIAASKKKGMWMGGLPPLGYDRPTDAATRALVVNDAEAQIVRSLFSRYLVLGSIHALAKELAGSNIRSKRHTTLKGKFSGGGAFSRGALFHLLKNRVYLGDIVHKAQVHPGAHPAIVDRASFDRAQGLLLSNTTVRTARRTKVGASPLKGLLFDQAGQPMSPTFSQGKSGRRYRYYVSSSLQRGVLKGGEIGAQRITATALEALLTERLARIAPFATSLAEAAASGLLLRVDALPDSFALTICADKLPHWSLDPTACLNALSQRLRRDERLWRDEKQPSHVRIAIAVSPRLSGGRTHYLSADGREAPDRARRDPILIRALRTAHGRAQDLTNDAPPARAIQSSYDRKLTRLAFLAPDIQRAILEGRQPSDMTLSHLIAIDLPVSWREQRRTLGFSTPRV